MEAKEDELQSQTGSVTRLGADNATGGDGEKSWERAWSIDEMKKGSTDWSLASDAGMLQHLQECSQRMVSRTHDIQEKMNEMINEAKLTEVRVNNTFNDFIMLANTQFIENRVYDEDVSTQGQEKQEEKKEKSKEEHEAELVPRVSTAMKLGLSVIETAFEKLDVEVINSDTEDEDADTPYKSEAILEPKDPYIHRPLPYLIGSQAFTQDDDVGLLDMMPSEEESDHGSLSNSDSESEDDEEIRHIPAHRPNDNSLSSSQYSSDSGSDLFNDKDSEKDDFSSDSDSEAENTKVKQAPSNDPLDFAAEIAKKINQANRPPQAVEEKASTPKSKKKKMRDKHKEKERKPTTTYDERDMFAAPTNNDEMSDEDGFNPQAGMFSGGGNLFADEDRGGLFDTPVETKAAKMPQPLRREASDSDDDDTSESDADSSDSDALPSSKQKQSISKSNKPAGGVAIFGGEPDDLFTPAQKAVAKPSVPSSKTPKPGPDLFLGDDEDEDEDLFASFSSGKKTIDSKAPSKVSSAHDALFDDDDDLFAISKPQPKITEEPETKKSLQDPNKTKKKLPIGAVSMFGEAPNPLAAALKARKAAPDSDQDDLDSWSDGDKASSSSRVSSATSRTSAHVPAPRSDSPSDSLFDNTAPSKAVSTSTSKSSTANNLVPSSKSNISSLFDDDEDNLFGSISAKSSSKQKTSSQKSQATASLFASNQAEDESDDEGMFGIPPPVSKPSPVVSTAPTMKVKDMPAKPNVEKPAKSLSLFDDAEEEDLFGESTKPKSSKTASSVSKASKPSLFEDDDMLFGGTPPSKALQSSTPSVDLFGAPEPVKKEPVKAEPIKKPSATKLPAPQVALSTPPAAAGPLSTDTNHLAQKGSTTRPKPAAVSVPGATTTSSSTDLFADDDDDDLFASAQPTKPAPTKVTGSKDALRDHNVAPPGIPVDNTLVNGSPPAFTILQNGYNDGDPHLPSMLNTLENIDNDGYIGIPSNQSVHPQNSDDDIDVLSPVKVLPTKPLTNSEDNIEENDLPVSRLPFKPLPDSIHSSPETNVYNVSDHAINDKLGDMGDEGSHAASSGSHDIGIDPATHGDPSTQSDGENEQPAPHVRLDKAGKPWRPAGAISMFGGMDPKSLLKNKGQDKGQDKDATDSGDVTKTAVPGWRPVSINKPTPAAAPPSQKPKPKPSAVAADPLLGAAVDADSAGDHRVPAQSAGDHRVPTHSPSKDPLFAPQITQQKRSPAARGSTTNKGNIGRLQAGLTINPSALMPGAAPPVRQAEAQAAGFDIPAQTSTLHSVSKDRAKIQTKRRPPSRKARRSAGDSSEATSPEGDLTNQVPVHLQNGRVSPEEDLINDRLGNIQPDSDRLRPSPPSQTRTIPSDSDQLFSGVPSSDTNHLFSSVPSSALRETEKPERTAPSPDQPSDDLYSSTPSSEEKSTLSTEDHLFSTDSTAQSTTVPSVDTHSPPSVSQTQESADIFSPSAITHHGTVPTTDTTAASKTLSSDPVQNKVKNLFRKGDDDAVPNSVPDAPVLPVTSPVAADDFDDIFADSSVLQKPSKTKSRKKKTDTKVPAADTPPARVDSLDDDIFADASINVKAKKTKSKKVIEPVDDDIFASSSVISSAPVSEDPPETVPATKSEKRKTKKAVTKDEDLFHDDTDIFSDLPPSKPRERKQKKKAAEDKPLFKTDVDDIFADLPSQNKPKKSASKKTKAEKAVVQPDSGEVPNIFDDPLNAFGS